MTPTSPCPSVPVRVRQCAVPPADHPTTCPYCREKRQWMEHAGIPFREYFVDTDQARMEELNGLLQAHSVPGGGVGTPVVYVNGDLLVNNPDREEVKRRLKFRS